MGGITPFEALDYIKSDEDLALYVAALTEVDKATISALQRENEALKARCEALAEYAEHTEECVERRLVGEALSLDTHCTCGLDAEFEDRSTSAAEAKGGE